VLVLAAAVQQCWASAGAGGGGRGLPGCRLSGQRRGSSERSRPGGGGYDAQLPEEGRATDAGAHAPMPGDMRRSSYFIRPGTVKTTGAECFCKASRRFV